MADSDSHTRMPGSEPSSAATCSSLGEGAKGSARPLSRSLSRRARAAEVSVSVSGEEARRWRVQENSRASAASSLQERRGGGSGE
jgi:hypothetical protein